MHSIRLRLIGMVTGIVLIISIFLGVLNIISINQFEINEAAMSLNLLAFENGEDIDMLLTRTEDVAKYAASTIEHYLDSPKDIQDEKIRNNLKEYIAQTFSNAAENIEGVDTFYIHFNENLVENDGFWYRKNKEKGEYEAIKIVNVPLYGEKEEGRTAWYYKPIKEKKAVWLLPYLNENINVYMISYCVPVYVKGQFVAVVGIDIDFSTIREMVKKIKVNKTGYAYISSGELGLVYYHPELPAGIRGAGHDIEITGNEYLLDYEATNQSLITYTYRGEKKAAAFTTLRNGMRLVITAPSKETFAGRKKAIKEALLIGIFAFLIAFVIAVSASEHIISPLLKLTEAARKIQEGDFDIKIEKEYDDEIGDLADALNISLQKINESMTTISDMAYHDELTGLKNHTAYEKKVRSCEENIKNDTAEFAVIMIDMNGLKFVNDTFGHSRGDEAIKLLSKLICEVFSHSPVYRIGGDEFAVIAEKGDLENLDELLNKLKPYQKQRDLEVEEPWTEISLAAGAARYEKAKDRDFASVFIRADQEMYKNKKAIKAGR